MPRRRISRQRVEPAQRKVDTRDLLPRFLIVCEGEKTERYYFEGFRVPRDIAKVYGVGANTVRVVERAIELRDEGDYTQVWCVFDRDSFPAAHFNEALALAKREEIHVAYSNEAFELWYLLHFSFVNTGLSRADYNRKLSERLGHPYKKNSPSMYDELESYQQTAIDNARRLLAKYEPCNPERDNPSTTVHFLVEELRKVSSR